MYGAQTTYGNKCMSFVRDVIESQRDYLLKLRAQWHINDVFRRGLQNVNDYDVYGGGVVLSNNSGNLPRFSGYNLIRQTINRTKSILIQSPPRREARASRNDIMASHRARCAKIVMDDGWHRFKIEQASHRVADAYIVTGLAVMSFYFDPNQGEVIGQDEEGNTIRTGNLVPRVDNPDRWIWDSRAQTLDECEYAIRVTVQPKEVAQRMFPHHYAAIENIQTTITDRDILENRLLNTTQAQGHEDIFLPKDSGQIVMFEFFRRPCAEYPEGEHAVFAGSTSTPTLTLMEPEENEYGDIPAVLFVQDTSSYTLLGNGTFVNDLLSAQREINRRAWQVLCNSDLIGNPAIKFPLRSGSPPQAFTNNFGHIQPYNPEEGNGPEYMAPPQMPQFVFEAQATAFRMFSTMAPTSPADIQETEKASSAIHASAIAEVRRNSAMTLVRNWELGWDAFWKLYVKLWKRFVIYPQQVRGLGPEGEITFETFSGIDIGDDVEVSVVPYSAMPTSRTAAFAEWTELLKLGFGRTDIPTDPMVMKRALQDIGKGDMTLTWRDINLDIDLADRIRDRVVSGEQIIPRIQDPIDLVLLKLIDFAKTPEYESMLKEDPTLEQRVFHAVDMYTLIKQRRDLNLFLGAQANAQMENGQVPGNPVQAAASTHAPGAPQGGAEAKQSQGFGKAANAQKNQGGNPG